MQPPEEIIESGPKPVSVQMETSGDNILHYAALPDGMISIEPVEFPDKPLITYPYELDEFQKTSVACIHRNESVLVSAHTSAGKTAIALYAIQAALNKNSRVVYTSPIKALSNQKFREFSEEFKDQCEVGLITGDVTTNPSAPILVMTTEILRMMLYKGDSLIREISWVVYDEIHYMKDVERGVVWEESIILLDHAIRYVFLSATIPNAREFSEWIAYIHNQPCHVVYTEYRPVPLQFFMAAPSQPYKLVKDVNGVINEENVAAVCQGTSANESKRLFRNVRIMTLDKTPNQPSKSDTEKATCVLANQLVQDGKRPMIIFAFGRKECDELSAQLGEKTFIEPEISNQVQVVFEATIEKLNDSDKELPQIAKIRDLVTRGIGIHHGGLIPLMKELVEVLFQSGLIIILFATETFAMGLNMPAQTVVFHSLMKFDGQQRRILQGGEFIQMAGRAGRRNNDKIGNVVISVTGETDKDDLVEMLNAKASPLNSEFHVTYHMILSLLCQSKLDPEQLMKCSFHQFQMERELPQLEKRIAEAEAQYESIVSNDFERAKNKINLMDQLQHFQKENEELRIKGMSIYCTAGRYVEVKNWGWGVLIAGPKKNSKDCLVALTIRNEVDRQTSEGQVTEMKASAAAFYSIAMSDILSISVSIVDIPDSFVSETITNMFSKLSEKVKIGIGKLDERQLVRESDKKTYDTNKLRIDKIQQLLVKLDDVSDESFKLAKEKVECQKLVESLKAEKLQLQAVVLHRDLQDMRTVLHKLDYINDSGLITDKGRVASVITAGDEIIMTEMLYDGILLSLNPPQIAGLLSIFASDESSKDTPEIPEELEEAWEKTKKIIEKIVNVSKESGIEIKLENVMKSIDPSYMVFTYNWATGSQFADLMEMNPQFFEGSVIRTIKRTEEILRQAHRAASQMGRNELESVILQAIEAIKRDIIFAASLYLNF